MKPKKQLIVTVVFDLIAFLWLSTKSQAQSTSGIPEPGLLMYGSVTNSNGNAAVANANVQWRIAAPSGAVTVNSTLVTVNGQGFYVARVPFETRSLGGTPFFAATPNTLELVQSGANYTRSAVVNGVGATIAFSSRYAANRGNFTFGGSDRGLVERVDLTAALPVLKETFAQWSQRYFGRPDANPNDDPDHDGVKNSDEFAAGTDPTSKDSAFKFLEIRPLNPVGITLRWSSESGKKYRLERSAKIPGNFSELQSGILAAAGGANSFDDSSATGPGPYFYRLTIQE